MENNKKVAKATGQKVANPEQFAVFGVGSIVKGRLNVQLARMEPALLSWNFKGLKFQPKKGGAK